MTSNQTKKEPTELEKQLAETKTRRQAIEFENNKLKAIADNLNTIKRLEGANKTLQNKIVGVDTTLPLEEQVKITKERRLAAETDNRRLAAVAENLEVIANLEVANKRLKTQTANPPA